MLSNFLLQESIKLSTFVYAVGWRVGEVWEKRSCVAFFLHKSFAYVYRVFTLCEPLKVIKNYDIGRWGDGDCSESADYAKWQEIQSTSCSVMNIWIVLIKNARQTAP